MDDNSKILIQFMNENLYLIENKCDVDIDKNRLKAAKGYKYLLNLYVDIKNITIDEFLKENEYDIGLIGPSHNCIVTICEEICSSKTFHLHNILHDV